MKWFAAIWLFVAATQAGAQEREIVLVHGSYVGAWYWNPVARRLRDMGHTVTPVELTGYGDRQVDDPAAVTVEDHIRDIVAAIEATGSSVVLVSHSYGGRPATGAWDRMRDHVDAVIYLEAVAPYGTGALALPDDTEQRDALARISPEAISAGVLEPSEETRARYPDRVLSPQSILALYAAVPLTKGPLPDTPGAYVIGSRSEASIFRRYAAKVKEERGWTIWEIDTGHDMVREDADLVARLIDKLASELPEPK